MFIVCGDDISGTKRVMDTDDNTVSSVTVEQLKLVQAMGYQIVFDKSKDYIYQLHRLILKPRERGEVLEHFLEENYPDIDRCYIDSANLVSDVFYLIVGLRKAVLIGISRWNNEYKMNIKDISKYFRMFPFDSMRLKGVSLCIASKDLIAVDYNMRDNTIRINFDINCNYVDL